MPALASEGSLLREDGKGTVQWLLLANGPNRKTTPSPSASASECG